MVHLSISKYFTFLMSTHIEYSQKKNDVFWHIAQKNNLFFHRTCAFRGEKLIINLIIYVYKVIIRLK